MQAARPTRELCSSSSLSTEPRFMTQFPFYRCAPGAFYALSLEIGDFSRANPEEITFVYTLCHDRQTLKLGILISELWTSSTARISDDGSIYPIDDLMR